MKDNELERAMGNNRFLAMKHAAEYLKRYCWENNYSLSMFTQNFLLNDITKDRDSIIAYYYKGRQGKL